MCLPDEDPLHLEIRSQNLLAMLKNFHDVGADVVIVSGDLPGEPMDRILTRCGSQPPTLVRLRAHDDEYERRLVQRGAPRSYIEWAHAYDVQFDRAGDLSLDTSSLTVAEAAAQVRAAMPAWTVRNTEKVRRSPAHQPGEAVLLCGPTAVGKSTVAWATFMHSLAQRVPTAYLDLAQIGWLNTADEGLVRGLIAANLQALWTNFSRKGAQRLVLSGSVTDPAALAEYRRALPAVHLTPIALTASHDSLRTRARLRADGQMIELPGDALRHKPYREVEAIALASAEQSLPVEVATRLKTDALTSEELSRTVVASAFSSARNT
jgi:chloramphenicol 3-O-phosphotransferase